MNNHTPYQPPTKPAEFYRACRQLTRIQDSLKLCREAESIAATYAAKRWGQEVHDAL